MGLGCVTRGVPGLFGLHGMGCDSRDYPLCRGAFLVNASLGYSVGLWSSAR